MARFHSIDPNHPVRSDADIARSIDALAARLRLPRETVDRLLSAYLPICALVDEHRRAAARPIVVGVSGGQGSGKTTFAAFAALLLERLHGWSAIAVSIDDFYLSRADRLALAERVHPLFATRGVPGTHDVELGKETLRRLTGGGVDDAVPIPAFDKADDDRLPRDSWTRVETPVDVVLFEGWCVGAEPQTAVQLDLPINALERDEDVDGSWRGHVNEELTGPYREWFSAIDLLAFFRVPDFESVRRWRGLQEEKLAALRPDGSGVMDTAALDRFLMHYERVTRHAVEVLPGRADVLCDLDTLHAITEVRISGQVTGSETQGTG